jgi:HAD superfamily hydrolase (TIGR01509 family)
VEAGAAAAELLGIEKSRVELTRLGPELDSLVDQLVAQAHRDDPVREVDIYWAYGRALQATLGLTPTPAQIRDVCHLLQLPWRDAITVDEEAAATLRQLQQDGARLGLLSNSPYPAHLMREMLAGQGLQQRFDAIVFSSEVGVRKPAPQAFAALLDRLSTPPADSWFVGDEWQADIEGSRRAGMTPILSPRGGAEQGEASSDVVRLKSWPELLDRWREARKP